MFMLILIFVFDTVKRVTVERTQDGIFQCTVVFECENWLLMAFVDIGCHMTVMSFL